jgi:hypothetical protein
MKKLNVEKSTLKWILIWISICCLFWLAVLAADFSDFYSDKNGKKLTDRMWDGVLWQLSGMQAGFFSEAKDYKIPAWTIIMYNGDSCPDKWYRWAWGDWDDTFLITPLKAWERNFTTWWSWEIQILLENMPKHSHYVVWGQGSAGLDQDNALSSKNFWGSSNEWDADYVLAWVSWLASKWKTNEVWSWKAIKFTPSYIKVLFCVKE